MAEISSEAVADFTRNTQIMIFWEKDKPEQATKETKGYYSCDPFRRGSSGGLALQTNSETASPLLEGTFAALKDVADSFSNVTTLEAAGEIGYRRQFARSMRAYLGNDDLVGVRVDNQIGIVGDYDYLALVLSFKEQAHELIED